MEAQVAHNIRVKPKKGPYRVDLTEGQTIYFCDCGRSKNQPYCDGAHQGTDFGPIAFTATETKAYYLCGCKHAGIKPLCDGTHSRIEW